MGTNFYIMAKKPRVVEVYDKFHIAKTSCGWKPLFDGTCGCGSVEKLKERYDTGDWEIMDEYGERYDWEQFAQRVLNHCPDGKNHYESGMRTRDDDEGYEFSFGKFS